MKVPSKTIIKLTQIGEKFHCIENEMCQRVQFPGKYRPQGTPKNYLVQCCGTNSCVRPIPEHGNATHIFINTTDAFGKSVMLTFLICLN
jgi:hypothetical protein